MPDEYDAHQFPAPVAGRRETSKAAAKAVEPRVGTIRRRVLDYLRVAGPQGRTRDEIEAGLSMGGSTVHPRVLELIAAGFAVETKFKRRTRAGKEAFVVVAKGHEPPEVPLT
jgi:hypothetical protein